LLCAAGWNAIWAPCRRRTAPYELTGTDLVAGRQRLHWQWERKRKRVKERKDKGENKEGRQNRNEQDTETVR